MKYGLKLFKNEKNVTACRKFQAKKDLRLKRSKIELLNISYFPQKQHYNQPGHEGKDLVF